MTKQEIRTVNSVFYIGFTCEYQPGQWWLKLVKETGLVLFEHANMAGILVACTLNFRDKELKLVQSGQKRILGNRLEIIFQDGKYIASKP